MAPHRNKVSCGQETIWPVDKDFDNIPTNEVKDILLRIVPALWFSPSTSKIDS